MLCTNVWIDNYRIRHKKCDETKPACTPCLKTGRICEFSSALPQTDRINENGQYLPLKIHQQPGNGSVTRQCDTVHFEYFRLVCAKEFALYFELPPWETTLLRVVHTEPCLHHAALALGALSRSRYQPGSLRSLHQSTSPIEYATTQYSLAIERLNNRLDASSYSYELAVLASIIFIALEVLQEHGNQVQALLRISWAILEVASKARSTEMQDLNLSSASTFTLDDLTRECPSDLDYLANALYQLTQQLSTFSV